MPRLSAGFPSGSDGKEATCNVGDLGSVPGLERSQGEGNSYPLQYSCLKNSRDRGTWQATIHGVTKEFIKGSSDYNFSYYLSVQ